MCLEKNSFYVVSIDQKVPISRHYPVINFPISPCIPHLSLTISAALSLGTFKKLLLYVSFRGFFSVFVPGFE